MKSILRSGFAELGIEMPVGAEDRFSVFCDVLKESNRVMNLTAITEEDEIARLHYIDSAVLGLYADFYGKSVVDVGTGAGFPGIPLKIMFPGIKLTLMDSQQKRVNFLEEACDALGFSDVECVCIRAEDAAQTMRESFDIAVSRAVARLNILCELCMPLVRVNGMFIAMKGPEPDEEVQEAAAAAGILGGGQPEVFAYELPGTDVRHTAVIVKKTEKTPREYPRRFAKIQKNPL